MVAPCVEIEVDVALQMDGEAEIDSGGEEDRAAAGRRSGCDGAIDGVGVESFAVTGCAVLADVEDDGRGGGRFFFAGCGGEGGQSGSGHAKTTDTEKIAARGIERDSLFSSWLLAC